jgi:hypothetical protein
MTMHANFCVAEPHHFEAAKAPGKNFDAAPGALAPTVLPICQFFSQTNKNVR